MNATFLKRVILTAMLAVVFEAVAAPVFAQSATQPTRSNESFVPAFAPQHEGILSPYFIASHPEASAQEAASPAAAAPPQPMPAGNWMEKPVGGRNYWGFEGGLTYNWLQGAKNFGYSIQQTAQNSPTGVEVLQGLTFANAGSGVGFLLGGVIDFALSDNLAFVGKLRYVDNSTSSDDTRDAPVNPAPNQMRVASHYSSSWQYADLEAMLRFQLTPDSWYLTGGLGFSSLLSNSSTLSKTIDSSGVGVSFADIVGNGTGETSLSTSGSISNLYTTTRLAFKFGVGTFIPLGSNGTVLAPELVADIPLTSHFSQTPPSGITYPTLWHVDLTIGIKFPWGGSTQVVAPPQETPAAETPAETNPDDMVNLKGSVHDKDGKPVDADMTVIDLSNNKVVATGHTDDGNYTMPVKKPGKYSVTADANGYMFGSTYFEVDKNGRILAGNHDITLTKAGEGRTRLLIFFDFGKDYLQSSSYPELDRAVRLMQAIPTMEVQIAGYTDNVGSDTYNQDLSLRRAKTVRNYIINHGVDGARVAAEGYGMADPVAPNDTDDGRAQNRRVEFVVVKK
jgi:hypothetical protein